MGGFMSYLLTDSKIARVNLSTKKITIEKINMDLAKKYLGGRGYGSKILCDEIDPKIDPLAKENKIIFADGLLSGSFAPTGGRYMVITKGLLTGTIASSNSGGYFGAELRKCGFFMLIIEGKSEKPVYLEIKNDEIQIKDATDLWGLDTSKTTDLLKEKIGVKTAKVSCIGPAGENLVKIAAIINDKARAAGRTGVGAIMGSKNLKAIVAAGNKKIEIENLEKFREVVKDKIKKLKENPVTSEGLPTFGTKVLDNIINSSGMYPTNNFQLATFKDVDEVSGEALVAKKYFVKNTACFACPIGCGRKVVLPDGHEGEGPEYESGWAFGADCGVNDLIAITKANFLCNELGLDTISAGTTIAAAMELFEKGYIKKEDFGDAVEPKFGSSEAVVYYTKAMAYREGLGDKMAEGSYRMAEMFGHPELSMTVKKQEIPAYDPRGVQGQALEFATSNRGACHVRGYLISPEILGLPEKLETQTTDGKAMWVKIFQDLSATIDAAGMCLFTSFALGAQDYAELLSAALSLDISADDVMKIGERIWNLERKFNYEAGIMPEEDTLPARFLKEGLSDGPQKGAVVKLHITLPDYYKLRGWNPDGTIPESKLKELEI